jgi:hypothetical protein
MLKEAFNVNGSRSISKGSKQQSAGEIENEKSLILDKSGFTIDGR